MCLFLIFLYDSFSRDLLISYLDQDLLIARDAFGTPEILRRKEFVAQRTGSNDSSDGYGAPSA